MQQKQQQQQQKTLMIWQLTSCQSNMTHFATSEFFRVHNSQKYNSNLCMYVNDVNGAQRNADKSQHSSKWPRWAHFTSQQKNNTFN